MVPGRFEGKVALVAGAARPPGLGCALALRLARGGALVICADAVGPQPEGGYDTGIVTAEILEDVAREVAAAGSSAATASAAGSSTAGFSAVGTGPGTKPIAVDPFDPTDWERAVAEAVARTGHVDIACAFMGTTGPEAGDGQLVDVPLASWRRCYDVNVTGPLLFARAAATDMVRRGERGALCFLSSYSAVVSPAGSGAISSARAALNHVVETLALELGPVGIRVNAVQPLSVQTGDPRFPNPGLLRLADAQAPGVTDWVRRNLPLGRPQTPDETAAVAEFLCSEEASFVTGVCVPVAGGAHAHS